MMNLILLYIVVRLFSTERCWAFLKGVLILLRIYKDYDMGYEVEHTYLHRYSALETTNTKLP